MSTKEEKDTKGGCGPYNGRIRARMKQLGMEKLEEFAEFSNIGATTVYNLVLGRVSSHGSLVKPSVDTLVKLSEALDVPLHVLLYELEPQAKGADMLKSQPLLHQVKVNYAGWAGKAPDQEDMVLDQSIWVEEEFARDKDLMAFAIRGDSMAAGKHPIYHGDVVLVDRQDKGHNNAAVVARLTNRWYVCKLLKEDKFSRIVRLISANPEHQNGTPTAVSPEDIAEIVGRVVRIIHDAVSPRRTD